MREMVSKHRWLWFCVVLGAVSIAGIVALGFKYHDESDYWLVGVPGFCTAIGTIGLAGATFRLIQRESQDRENTLTALRHSQIMATEAARQRRDARARLLRISHYLHVEIHLDPAPRQDNQQTDGAAFNMPGDANKMLYVSQFFNVVVADGQPLTIAVNGLSIRDQPQTGRENIRLPLNPGMRGGVASPSLTRFTVGRTVADWVEIAEQRAQGLAGSEGQAWIAVDDNFDDGVIDSYELTQSGSPLRRSPQLDGQWLLDSEIEPTGYRAVVFATRPMVRRYYVSKNGDRPLDEPDQRG